jgi:hypothetical protein
MLNCFGAKSGFKFWYWQVIAVRIENRRIESLSIVATAQR